MKTSPLTRRLFRYQFSVLIICMVAIYLTLVLFLPQLYRHYKVQQTQEVTETLVTDLTDRSLAEAQERLAAFKQNHSDLTISLYNEAGELLLFPSVLQDSTGLDTQHVVNISPAVPVTPAAAGDLSYSIEHTVTLEQETYTLKVFAALQPVNEIPKILLMLLPILLLVVLLIAFFIARRLSTLITKPLLEINQRAKRFEKLSFERGTSPVYHDELEELSRNLDSMATNLQNTMRQLQETNDALEAQLAREQQAKAQQIDLLIALGHDLKTPLAVVKGILEGIRLEIPPYTDQQTYLEKAENRLAELNDLVTQINEIAKVEHTAKPEKFSLDQLARLLLVRHELQIQEKNLQLTLELQPITLTFDRFAMERLLGNLIENAIYYTNPNGIVRLRLVQEPEAILFSLYNETDEISEEQLVSLFEPMTRLDTSRNHHIGGSGLGLFLVKQILTTYHLTYQLAYKEHGLSIQIHFPNP